MIYPKEGVFFKHGREIISAPNFVTSVCHMSPYTPHKLRKDFWEKLEAERPVFERLATAAVKREDEVVSCMVLEDRLVEATVDAVTHPSGKRVRCGLPAKAGVETTPISGGGSKREDEVVSCMVQEDTVGAVTHPSGKVRCGLPAEEAGVETTPISAVGTFSTQSWQDSSGVLEQSVRKAEAQLDECDESQAGGSVRAMYTCCQSAKSPKLTRKLRDSAKIVDILPVQDDMDLDEPEVQKPLSAEERVKRKADPVDEPEEYVKRTRLQLMKRSVFGVKVGRGTIVEWIVRYTHELFAHASAKRLDQPVRTL
ncbi:hypothetical protein SARC_11736 [Sphaeroforma arctica JP610]|uniref:Uncharacterized protein n=1 Tax=Sphaeroforma arctica JP610 TaxID=667725 RepID=A0A0L0FG46_9EUKA|nr:hypothetical protein SARC_11736 [Sphaeroforma arctica JP610]KNC75744.1 hypothetical protein SARC_11736 [Sphaeroforma arctica JP610]|eukprot:XP_014149646.1 hypothetical protein SARC_11736 [Sphaeroforma arctica JP610]